MQQANMRISPLDHFAIKLQNQAQHAVGRRMLRTEVQRVFFISAMTHSCELNLRLKTQCRPP